MTEQEAHICKCLGNVTCLGGFDKRFMNAVAVQATNKPESELSDKQKEWMFRLLYKYRRQLPNLYKRYQTHPHCQQLKKQ